ncbi:MAG TPA: hydrogenase maturation nickel metallochaperone HypA [Solirubrobacteraceae bacterium]|nr:hydrogenase maturation nickel metallochaperone HypA [Solirubrobacteraceae bacterium]
MHELSVATAVLNTALKHAGGRPVEVVAMRAGSLRQVVPDSLRFYWEVVARDTECQGARLEIEEIDVWLRCEDCGREWEPLIAAFRCPQCASAHVDVVAGEELEIDYLELSDRLELPDAGAPRPGPPPTPSPIPRKEPAHA